MRHRGNHSDAPFVIRLPLAAYAYLILQQRQSVVPIGAAGDAIPEPLLLAPALFIFALTLLFLRVLPILIRLAEWLGHWVAGPTLLLALRQLARQPDDYSGLIFMLVMTLAIGVFSASAALTIDLNGAQIDDAPRCILTSMSCRRHETSE